MVVSGLCIYDHQQQKYLLPLALIHQTHLLLKSKFLLQIVLPYNLSGCCFNICTLYDLSLDSYNACCPKCVKQSFNNLLIFSCIFCFYVLAFTWSRVDHFLTSLLFYSSAQTWKPFYLYIVT